MVVKELIEHLKTFDEEKEVKILDDCFVEDITCIYESPDSEIILRS